VLEKANAAVKIDDAARRKYESAIKDLQQKISKYRDQMLDVKTNDQYRALQHEIDFSNQEIRATEDKILELMMNAETREKQVKAAEAELKAETAEIEKEKAEARERTAEDEKQLKEWNSKRETFRAGIPADLLQVMLRPQTYNEVRSGNQVIICDSCQRILYFDPASEVVVEKVSVAPRRRHHPKADAPRAWVYRSDYGDHGEVLLIFVNEKGNSTRRIYDFNTGRQVGDILQREGDYRLAFPEDFSGDYVRLNGNWDEEEMESWQEEMPMTALDSLHSDLQAARAESKSHNQHAPEVVPTEHPAAS